MNTLKIIQHNVQGWSNNKTPLANIYNQLDAEIILLNETGHLDKTPKIFNYNTFYSNKNNRHRHGTAIAIKHGIQYRLLDDFETDLLGLTIHTRQGEITIATLYSPPNEPYLNFIDFLRLFRRQEPVYFLGDLNARHNILGHNDSNAVGRNVQTLIQQDRCRLDGPHFPTLIRHNSATTPDIVLTANTFHNLHLQAGPLTPSDHIPIIATITVNPIAIPIKPRKSFHHANWPQYKAELETIEIPTDPHLTLEQIDEHLDTWTQAVKQASDNNIPTIQYRTLPGIRQNDETRRLQRLYDQALETLERYGPSIELSRHISDLKRQLRTEYQQTANQTWDRLIENLDIQEDPQKFWKTTRRLQGNDKQKAPYIRDHNNKKLHTPQDKEQLFRNHWQKIFTDEDDPDLEYDVDFTTDIETRLNDNFDAIRTYDYGDLNRLGHDFPPITDRELRTALATFKQKAPGPTGITTLHLRKLPINMRDYLRYIFNQAISAGYFPDTLKHANMIFIPKGNQSQHNITNYRPISLLDVHGKLLDKILNTRLTSHLSTHDLYNTRQHGFRKHRGTHTALATFQETIAGAMAQKFCTDVVLRDVAKAFDKVWHTGLKYKITTLNIHPCFTKTLSDYLTDRTASITIDNYTGPSFALESGVPQGACLSPTLFTLYTHDIPDPLPNTEYIAFADDITQITFGPYKYRDATRNTQHAIQQINTFEEQWKIKTNANKFKVIALARRNTEPIETEHNLFDYTNEGKILGHSFSKRGIKPQITQRTAIAKASLTKLNRFRQLSRQNKLRLYKTLIRPALIYPVIPLHTARKSQLKSLQRVQNKALRFITNTHWTEYRTSRSLHEECQVKPINQYLHQQARSLWNKIQTNTPQLYQHLANQIPPYALTHIWFPSSREVAERRTPPPLYT